ncbi:MAG: sulfatase-like hydrolase/transferase, partial [Roseibacillus sp.]
MAGIGVAATPLLNAHELGGEEGHTHLIQAPARRGGGDKGPRIKKPRIEDTIVANIYADNWFVMYLNGRLAVVDSIPFIPHNVISVNLLPEYPMTIAVMARDNGHPRTGMEYNNTNTGDGGFVLKFGDGTVTSAKWKAKNFFHGPIGGDETDPKVKIEELPADWFAVDFDDSRWPSAKEYTEKEIGPKKPYYDSDFKGAKWIWSDNLKLDNTVIFRYVVEAPPNGAPVVDDWPRGHIVPSATQAEAVENASSNSRGKTTGAAPVKQRTTAAIPVATNSRIDPSAPPQAKAFAPFVEELEIKWDKDYLYIGADAFPDHPMMTGITAWNQQVPLPQKFYGDNAWRLPLHPVPAKNPVSAKTSLFKGAIAMAINGVPIFNPIKQDGRTDTNLAGELDQYGGHAGRADDYHYHLPPTFLNKLLGDAQPIGFGMDGYALYGFNEPDGKPAKKLDQWNGHEHGDLGYHYHSTKDYPYLNGGLRGETALRDGQVANQPRTQGVRPYTRPLRGAKITGFKKVAEEKYSLDYDHGGKTYTINYTLKENGGADFEFVDASGTVKKESYEPRQRRGGGGGERGGRPDGRRREGERPRGEGERPRPPGEGRGERPRPEGERRPRADGERPPRGGGQAGDGPRTPWILVHAPELDTNKDGTVTMAEVMEEARAVFKGYDVDKDGFLSESEMKEGRSPVRSALNGFVKQHNLEMDRDGDKKVSAEEMAGQFRGFVERQDQNGDGKLSPDESKVEGEIRARFPERPIPRQEPRPNPRAAPRERSSKAVGDKPNIVFFLIDDMGWNDMGFSGSKFIETPHTDRLAKAGVVFTNAYSSAPNCAPTRACLLSGQYPSRHGVYTVVDDRHAPGSAHHRMLAATSNASMAGEVVTIAEQLKAGGYATAMFGMWNLGRGREGPATPTGQGFDVFERPQSLGFEKDRYFNEGGEYLTDRFTEEAIGFMAARSKGSGQDEPFFVYLAYHGVHSPFEAKPDLVAKYKKMGVPDADYAATVEAVDQNVGRVMAALGELGVMDNTLVIFTSDNGGNRRHTAPLRSGKGSVYEGGIRVPAAVWGPGL